jgi:uncharacterized C2H2 Zn-finger protein
MNALSMIIFVVDGKAEVQIQRENDLLKCISCNKLYRSVDSLKKHIGVCDQDGDNAPKKQNNDIDNAGQYPVTP